MRLLIVASVLAVLACGENFETEPSGSGGASASAARATATTRTSTTSSSQGGGLCGPGSVAELSDSFDGVVFAPQWEPWNGNGATVSQNNELIVSIETGTNARYAGVSSVATYALTGCGLSVKLSHPPTALGATAFLKLEIDDSNFIWTRLAVLTGTTLVFSYRANGVPSTPASVPFDASEQRYWRISEKSGFIVWETSPDAETWIKQHEEPVPFEVDALHVTISAGGEGTIGTATEARFDDVNLP